MQTVLLVFHIFVALALIRIILLQRSNSDGLGLSGGGGGNNFMSGRASANFLTRATSVLAAVFMLNSLALAYLVSHSDGQSSIVNQVIEEQKAAPTIVTPKEDKSSVPLAK